MGALLGGKCPHKTMHLTAHSYPITERGSPPTNTHDDDLRVPLGRIRNRGARYKGFFAEICSEPGTKDTSAPDRKVRDPRGPTLRILAADAATPCDYDQGPDLAPDTRAVHYLRPGFSIRPDTSSSKHASGSPRAALGAPAAGISGDRRGRPRLVLASIERGPVDQLTRAGWAHAHRLALMR
jgi:hypothetical protein